MAPLLVILLTFNYHYLISYSSSSSLANHISGSVAISNIDSPVKKINFVGAANGPEFAAKNALAGFIVYALNEQIEQKYFKANYIKNLHHNIHSVMIGSSHMLPVSSVDVGTKDFVNLAIGGSNLQDRLDILGMLDYYNIEYDHVIFEIDLPSFLDSALLTSDGQVFKRFGDRFYNKIWGDIVSTSSQINFNDRYVSNYEFDTLLSGAYDENQLLDNIYYYRPDASMIYPKRSELFNEEHIKSIFLVLKKQDEMLKAAHINEQSKIIVFKIMEYFKKNNKKVNLVIAPRPNREFDESGMKDYPILQEVTDFAKLIASAYGFKISGSFNPHDLWLSDKDFADGFHLRGDVTSRIFDFNE